MAAPEAAAAPAGRIAVVDIGSNSIRLVVYDRLQRAPTPVFNERVLCGLARGLTHAGRLNDKGLQLALTNLVRFSRLTRAMRVERLDMLATAAVREARNGAEFVAEVERRCEVPVRVLSGGEEARLAALGVVSGTPGADGIMGDMGGGSLELVALHDGELGESATLPLGPLRLAEIDGGDRTMVEAEIDRALDRLPWLGAAADRSFYPVGGSWRSLARLHMEQSRYPLHVIHGYRLTREEAADLADVVAGLGRHSLQRIRTVSRRRLETLPYAALVMRHVLARTQPAEVMFSAAGLREGHLFDLLGPEEQERDPLIAAASDLAASEGRFGDLGAELTAWTASLFAEETAQQARLRRAAGHLADVAWREHPDYRAEQALYRILRLPAFALDHAERAFLAYAVFVRYGGRRGGDAAAPALALLSPEAAHRAEKLGLALRLAITVSGGTRDVLAAASLERQSERLLLRLPPDGSAAPGDAMQRRFDALVNALGLKGGEIVG